MTDAIDKLHAASVPSNLTDEPFSPFAYQAPPPGSQPVFEALAERFERLYRDLLVCCPRSAERTLAIRKLQETRAWANAAIVFNGRSYPL